jgi:MFS family permease
MHPQAKDSKRPDDHRAFRVLRHRNFLFYWLGQLISLVGTWMQQLALNWVVLSLSKDAFALGTVNFVGAVPPALLLLFGGTIADRFAKRKVLIVSQCAFMIGAFVLAFIVKSGEIRMWHILVVAAAMGVAQAFDLPASQSLVPELVEPQDIAPAVQLNQAIFHGSRFLGPMLAGFVIARFGVSAGFVVNGLSFIPVIGTLFVIRSLRREQPRANKESTLQAIKTGFAFVRSNSLILHLMGLTALTATLVFPNFAVLMPYYVKEVLHQNAGVLGTVMGASGLGAFIGAMALVISRPKHRVNRIGLGMLGVTCMMTSVGVLGFMPNSPARLPLICLAVAIQGVCLATTMGLSGSIVQQVVPDELRGRVTSLQTLVFIGIMPFASLLVTKIVDLAGMPLVLIVSALAYGSGAAVLYGRLKLEATMV